MMAVHDDDDDMGLVREGTETEDRAEGTVLAMGREEEEEVDAEGQEVRAGMAGVDHEED